MAIPLSRLQLDRYQCRFLVASDDDDFVERTSLRGKHQVLFDLNLNPAGLGLGQAGKDDF